MMLKTRGIGVAACVAAGMLASSAGAVTFSKASATTQAVRFPSFPSTEGTTGTGIQTITGPGVASSQSQTDYTFPFSGGAHGVAQASASAQLSTGLLRGSGTSNCSGLTPLGLNTICNGYGVAQTSSQIADVWRFSAPDLSTALAQVTFTIDGFLTPAESSIGGAAANASLVLFGIFPNGSHSPATAAMFSTNTPNQVLGDWIDPVFSSSSTMGLDGTVSYAWSFTGFLPLANFQNYVFSASLNTIAQQGASVDFSNTAHLSVQLGQDVTLATESGVFGAVSRLPTGGVPEPATWTMLIAGFAATGSWMRRQRARACNP